MADYENQLLSKAIQTGHVEELIVRSVGVDHFTDNDNKEVWEFALGYFRKYKKSPAFETMREQFPDYNWSISSEPLDFIFDKFETTVTTRKAQHKVERLAEYIDEGGEEQLRKLPELFLDEARDLARSVPSTKISRFSSMSERIEQYYARKEAGLTMGLPYGIPALDEITLGLHPHQYITIAGWTGTGKSWLALILALNHYTEGATPMLVSLEMDEEEVHSRLDAIAVGIKQQAIKGGNLTATEIERWQEYAEKAEQIKNDIIVVDVDFATVEKVYAETARWQPDVVFVDYIQLMLAPKYLRNSWERVGYISQMLKAQARQMRIPIYGLAQSNVDSADQGARLTNLAGSKDIGKHSDLVLGMFQDENMKEKNRMEINVEKNRSGPSGDTIALWWNPSTAIFRPWRDSDSYPVEAQINGV